jgi:mRNA-degrading endonuclease RelE of RelBE toxin-antitoxin system
MRKPSLHNLPLARGIIKKLNPAIKPIIKAEVEGLMDNPCGGKDLTEELLGFRSLAIGRYRVIYRYNEPSSIEILFIGHRRGVYERFREMLDKVRMH